MTIEEHLIDLVGKVTEDPEFLTSLQETGKDYLKTMFDMLKTKRFESVWTSVI
jgi:hypothetical protein